MPAREKMARMSVTLPETAERIIAGHRRNRRFGSSQNLFYVLRLPMHPAQMSQPVRSVCRPTNMYRSCGRQN